MTRETKIGLLVGLLFIVAFGLVLSGIMPKDSPSAFPPESRGTSGSGSPVTTRQLTVSQGGVEDQPVASVVQPGGSSVVGEVASHVGPGGASVPGTVDSRVVRPADSPVNAVSPQGGVSPVTQPPSYTTPSGQNTIVWRTPAEELAEEMRLAANAQLGHGQQVGLDPSGGRQQQPGQIQPVQQPVPPVPVNGKKYIVKAGDTLYSIARFHYGNGAHHTRIFDANKAVLPNPNSLKVGTELVLPALEVTPVSSPVVISPTTPTAPAINQPPGQQPGRTSPTVAPPLPAVTEIARSPNPGSNTPLPLNAGGAVSTPQTTYTVQEGDTLFSIAKKFGTTVDKLKKLNGIENPNFLRVGQKLRLS